MTERVATLDFQPGTWTGFTPTGVAGFTDVQPERIVRELIQNSLDAAAEATEPVARVCFRLREIQTDAIPGICDYEEELHKVRETQTSRSSGSLPDHAREVLRRMDEALEWDSCHILVVTDNGIGLDPSRMGALLSDGTSVKGIQAAGSYGNGHMVSIPASDLRYVLYGGVREGRRIGSGHAILASSYTPGEMIPTSGNGYYIVGHDGWSGNYVYPEGAEVPSFIGREIDRLERDWGHGSVVIVTAFNGFHEDLDGGELWRIVARAAAFNFFAAIEDGFLEVSCEYLDENDVSRLEVLTKDSLGDVLGRHRREKRAKKGSFLSGSRAYDAWTTVRTGSKHTIATGLGDVTLHLRESMGEGMTRVELCRNGMRIVDQGNIPGFFNQFREKDPFHAVLALDSEVGRNLHRLVRKAEGPLHDTLSPNLLRPQERKDLRAAFAEIRAWLKERVAQASTKSYSPDDFLVVESDEGIVGLGTGKSELSLWGTPEAVRRWRSGVVQDESGPGDRDGPHGKGRGGRGKGGKGGGGRGADRPSRRRPSIRALAVPVGSNRCRVRIETLEDCEDARLMLCIDENTDQTCDRLWREDSVKIRSAVSRRGALPLVRSGNGSELDSISLGRLAKGGARQIDVEYELPEDWLVNESHRPVLRVEITSSGESHVVTPKVQDTADHADTH